VLVTGWSASNFYTFFIECIDYDIMFLIIVFDTVCCYTSCLSAVFSNIEYTITFILLVSFKYSPEEVDSPAVSALGVRSRNLSNALNGQ
jgi:hypothetical protein